MTRKTKARVVALSAISVLLLAGLTEAASLEYGHVRARTRGWVEDEASVSNPETNLGEEATTQDVSADWRDSENETSEPAGSGSLFRSSMKRGARLGSGLLRIGRRAPERSGYLARGAPNMLRFSDDPGEKARAPSPALPEFAYAPNEYTPYLIESDLPEDEREAAAMLSEIVIELEPHKVVSGKIDTRRATHEELVEHFELDEQRTTVLKPEEVLIFFETNGRNTGAGGVIPFSPATPTTETIKSSAKLKKVK